MRCFVLALLLVSVAGNAMEEGRNALFDDGGGNEQGAMPFNDYSFGDSGDDEADTMGAVYHMSQAEFQRGHSDFKKDARTASQAKAAHDFDAKVDAKVDAKPASALAQGMAKENAKLHKLDLDEATEVAAVQAQRENAAAIQDSNRPDLMEDASVPAESKANHHQRMQAPVSWHAGGQDSANEGMVATYHPKFEREEKKDAAKISKFQQKNHLLQRAKAPVMTNPWDPTTSLIQLDEGGQEHEAAALAASNAAFERKLERVESMAHEQKPARKHAAVHVVPLEDEAYQRQLAVQAADNAKFEAQLKRVEDLAKHATT